LQFSSHEIQITKNNNGKRPREANLEFDCEEEGDDDAAEVAAKRARKGVDYTWMWADGTSDWKAYDDSANERIENALKTGFRVFKVTNQWFIDFIHMEQRRSDDPTKRRKVKRTEQAPPSSESGEVSE